MAILRRCETLDICGYFELSRARIVDVSDFNIYENIT